MGSSSQGHLSPPKEKSESQCVWLESTKGCHLLRCEDWRSGRGGKGSGSPLHLEF